MSSDMDRVYFRLDKIFFRSLDSLIKFGIIKEVIECDPTKRACVVSVERSFSSDMIRIAPTHGWVASKCPRATLQPSSRTQYVGSDNWHYSDTGI
jgi:hypothetical protein